MSNRMPRPDAECRVCLVSLEGRGDLVKPDPPPVDTGFRLDIIAPFGEPEEGLASSERALLGAPGGEMILRPMGHASFFLRKERLVLLYSWKFFNEGFASFRELMQRLDVAMMGTVRDDAAPKVADTGHLPVKLQNRDGAEEHVLYRGPLVPFPLSRDPLGPYHSADQARRVNAETGAEDVSYAAAFETGRLLAAADGRLGQELLRWRQDAYRHSVRADEAALIVRNLSLPQALDLHAPLVPVVATRTMDRVLEGSGPLADPYGLRPIDKVPGLNPAELRQAWNLSSDDAAAAILGKPGDSVTPAVEAPAVTGRAPTTIDQVASTAPLLDHLDRARDRVLTNVRVRLEEKP